MPSKKSIEFEKVLEKARDDFFTFCQVVTKEDGFIFAPFHKFICDRINKELKYNSDGMRECFSVPPGYGKSTILSQLLPAYLLGKFPAYLILLISYSSTLSVDNAKKAKKIIEKPIYKLIFPETELVGNSLKPDYYTSQDGVIRALGRGGTITGRRANFILIDDILSGPEEANSDAIINKLHEWFPSVARSRLLPGGGICILSTRWTKKDLIGLVTSNKRSRWNYINLECISSGVRKDPLGRKKGEVLWPDFYTEDLVLETKAENERLFEVVYQGNCTAKANTLINTDYIQFAEKTEIPPETYTIFTLDTASKVSIRNDFTVIVIAEVTKDFKNAYITEIIRRKLEFPDLLELYDDLVKLYVPNLVLVENANCGSQLYQMRKESFIYESANIKDKEKGGLAEVLDVKFRYGQIKLMPHIIKDPDIIMEIGEFPYGSHDDVVMALLHFLRWFLDDDLRDMLCAKRINVNIKDLARRVNRLGNKYKKQKLNNKPSRGLIG